MLNLIGEYECKPDAKGRVLLPSALKKQLATVLDKGFVLKRSVFNKCIELYPIDEWNAVMAKVNTLNRFVKKNNDFIRLFTAGVKLQEVDGSGRILIPKDLKNFAGLQSTIVMSSSVNMIEIWDQETYEETLNNPETDFGQLAEDVMGGLNNPEDVS
ncbi:MAG: division/cell wall cluster transcriptional repressor MraZ [Schleiferiaceae bacterium]|jgi:MraZ protein|nr:division/cell wall cluster transcriptional repressor MraZ [Schleiferiaceae bacterium]